jgi:hypothetical protein
MVGHSPYKLAEACYNGVKNQAIFGDGETLRRIVSGHRFSDAAQALTSVAALAAGAWLDSG